MKNEKEEKLIHKSEPYSKNVVQSWMAETTNLETKIGYRQNYFAAPCGMDGYTDRVTKSD